MPLAIVVTMGSPTPVYRQIVDQIVTGISSGELEEGEALPSVRALADELMINANTVVRAYAELARDGIIESQSTRGMFVAPRRPLYRKEERMRRMEPVLRNVVAEALKLGFSPDEIREALDAELDRVAPKRR